MQAIIDEIAAALDKAKPTVDSIASDLAAFDKSFLGQLAEKLPGVGTYVEEGVEVAEALAGLYDSLSAALDKLKAAQAAAK